MMYLAFPLLILLMLGYMFWLAAFRLRRDRVLVTRQRRRFMPRHRPSPAE